MHKWQYRLSRDEFDRRERVWMRLVTVVACIGGGAAAQLLIVLDRAVSEFSSAIPQAAGSLRLILFTSIFLIFVAILTTARRATRRLLQVRYSSSYHDVLRGPTREELLQRLQPHDKAA